MAHGQAGKAHAQVGALAIERERRLALCVVIRFAQRDPVAQADNVLEQRLHFTGFIAIVQRGDDLDRLGDFFQIGFQLGFDVGVEHGDSSRGKG